MKKSFLVTLSLVCLVILSLSFTKQKDPVYKNLKVLPKDITKEQMDSVMHHFTDALNVKCGFCHVRNEETKKWDHASDDNKHKLIARDMLKMTNQINDDFFNYNGEKRNISTQLMVTCYTCHNGNKEPKSIPPKEEKPKPQEIKTDTTKTNR